ncbi:hypothetical protein B0H13DRAFT_2365767 [Mycena leptocephala]|nr:hypothetical protein B0H13DRAFT_2365767 [Mycena leptocephala]
MAPSHLTNSGLALRAAIKRVEISEIGVDVGAQAGDALNADPGFPTSAKIALMVAGLVAFLVLVYLKLRSRPKTTKAQDTAQKLEESDGD